jgi:hypothetical protein
MLHPIVLALVAADLVGVFLLLLAALGSVRIVAGWQPGVASRAQLELERRAEAVSLQGCWAALMFLFGSLVLIVAIADLLPPLVPGAMCGTGVVQATGGAAARALGLRLLALLLLGSWHLHDRLDRQLPTAPLAPLPARLLLLATPVAILAVLDTLSALSALDLHTPVDCCTVVFDQVRSLRQATTLGGVSDRALTLSTLLFGLLLAVAAGGLVARVGWGAASAGRGAGSVTAPLLFAGSFIWVPLASLALVRVFSAYYYGVLQHHCPWCLFLPEHRCVGYLFLAALLIVLLDGGAIFQSERLARGQPLLATAALRRARRGALRLLLALGAYALLALLPALLWRLRFGVWISG